MNNIKVIRGDCLNVMETIKNRSIDLVLADPPYGNTACKWDSIIPFKPMWKQINRIIKQNGAIALFGSEPFSSHLRLSNIKNYKYDWLWKKNKTTGFLNAKIQPLRQHENILIFYKKQSMYNPQMTTGHKPVNQYTKHTTDGSTIGTTKIGFSGGGSTKRYPVSILNFAVVNQDGTTDGGKFHPTQKPVLLLEYLIKTYTNKNETILDFTMGSGSTMIAAINTGRKGIGIELDKKYFKIAKERIISHKRETRGNGE